MAYALKGFPPFIMHPGAGAKSERNAILQHLIELNNASP